MTWLSIIPFALFPLLLFACGQLEMLLTERDTYRQVWIDYAIRIDLEHHRRRVRRYRFAVVSVAFAFGSSVVWLWLQ